MNNIILIINILIIGISAIAVISFYSTKRSLKEREKEIKKTISVKRQLTEQERASIKKWYKKNIPLETHVYEINGLLESNTLTTNGQDYSEYWIGGIQVDSKVGSFENILKENENYCEFCYIPGRSKFAIPLTVNNVSIVNNFIESDPKEIVGYRDLSKKEQRYLDRQFRWLPLLLLPFSILLLTPRTFSNTLDWNFNNYIIPGSIGFLMLLISIITIFHPKRYVKGLNEVSIHRGALVKSDKKGIIYNKVTTSDGKLTLKYPRLFEKFVDYGSTLNGTYEAYVRPKKGKIVAYLLAYNSFNLEHLLSKHLIIKKITILFYSIFISCIGLIHLNIIENKLTLQAVKNYLYQNVKIVRNFQDLDNIYKGDIVQFEDFMVFTNSDNVYKPYSRDFYNKYELEPDKVKWYSFISNYYFDLNKQLKGIIVDNNGNPVNLLDEEFDSIETLYCTNLPRLESVLFRKWDFSQYEPIFTNFLIIADKYGTSKANIKPFIDFVLESIDMYIEAAISNYDEFSTMYKNSLKNIKTEISYGFNYPTYELEKYNDPRKGNRNPEILEAYIFDHLKDKNNVMLLNGKFFLKDYILKLSMYDNTYPADNLIELESIKYLYLSVITYILSALYLSVGILLLLSFILVSAYNYIVTPKVISLI